MSVAMWVVQRVVSAVEPSVWVLLQEAMACPHFCLFERNNGVRAQTKLAL